MAADAGATTISHQLSLYREAMGSGIQDGLSEADGPGVWSTRQGAFDRLHSRGDRALASSAAPGLRLLIATAATFPVWNTAAIVVTSSSMLRPDCRRRRRARHEPWVENVADRHGGRAASSVESTGRWPEQKSSPSQSSVAGTTWTSVERMSSSSFSSSSRTPARTMCSVCDRCGRGQPRPARVDRQDRPGWRPASRPECR